MPAGDGKWWEDDLDDMLEDFGETVTFRKTGSVDVKTTGIFGNGFDVAGEATTVAPQVSVKSAAVSTVNKSWDIIIRAKTYRAVTIQDEGTGITRFILAGK